MCINTNKVVTHWQLQTSNVREDVSNSGQKIQYDPISKFLTTNLKLKWEKKKNENKHRYKF